MPVSNSYTQLVDPSTRKLKPETLPLAKRQEWTTKTAVFSYPFLVVVIWGSWEMTASYFYFTTVYDQFKWISNGDTDFATMGAFVFSILMPCGAIFAPIARFLLGTSPSTTVLALSVSALFAGVISVIPYLKEIQYVTIVLSVFNRYLLFAAKPLIFDKLWGALGSTTLYGVALFFISAVNYTTYGWIHLSKITLGGNYMIGNLTLGIGAFLSGLYFAWKLREWAPVPVHELPEKSMDNLANA